MNIYLFFLFYILSLSVHCTVINLNSVDTRLSNGQFPTFYGIGGLSGGGATSKLLVSYPEKYKSEIYDFLFKHQFGASLHMLKVEIGGDSQSTEGTEASHSHFIGDLNCNRGYEWSIMKEAKKRNPNITLYALPWAFPGWVGENTNNPYQNVHKLADYVISWINCSVFQHNLPIDYIGIWNEKHYNSSYIKLLRSLLNKYGFKKTKIVASDNKWEISPDINADKLLADSVFAVGAHYPGTYSDDASKLTGKPLWSSEDYSTNNLDKGPGCWARILNQNFVNGNMTSTISWNLIASYYDDLPYPRCGLATAIEPWSGHYLLPDTVWVTAHTTQFTQPGWNYVSVDMGGSGHLNGGGSYVTLVSDLQWSQLTIVLETMSHDNSVCIRPNLPPYKVVDQNVTIKIPKDLIKKNQLFYVWRTKITSNLDQDKFHYDGFVKPDSKGEIILHMPVDNLVTLTTVSNGHKGSYSTPPKSQEFPSNYTDDFEKYPLNSEPDLLTPQVGSFEVKQITDGKLSNKVLHQTVLATPISWCFLNSENIQPIAVIGNFNRSNYHLSVMVNQSNDTPNANRFLLGARINNSGCTTFLAGGVFFWLDVAKKQVSLANKYNYNSVYKVSNVKLKSNSWQNMSMILNNNHGWFYLNEKLVMTVSNLLVSSPPNGFVAIGTGEFGGGYFDNLVVKEI